MLCVLSQVCSLINTSPTHICPFYHDYWIIQSLTSSASIHHFICTRVKHSCETQRDFVQLVFMFCSGKLPWEGQEVQLETQQLSHNCPIKQQIRYSSAFLTKEKHLSASHMKRQLDFAFPTSIFRINVFLCKCKLRSDVLLKTIPVKYLQLIFHNQHLPVKCVILNKSISFVKQHSATQWLQFFLWTFWQQTQQTGRQYTSGTTAHWVCCMRKIWTESMQH